MHAVYQDALKEMPSKCIQGDIVICSVNGKNFSEPCALGKVHCVHDVDLPKGHKDGDKGEVFVLSYDKQMLRRKQSIPSLKSKLFVHL